MIVNATRCQARGNLFFIFGIRSYSNENWKEENKLAQLCVYFLGKWIVSYADGKEIDRIPFKFDLFNNVALITARVSRITGEVSIKLNQNYPNPFNPSTTISFNLPVTMEISLKVYDLLGREVATLINNEQYTAGLNNVTFDASNLASGMYIYELTSANLSITKKMSLIK